MKFLLITAVLVFSPIAWSSVPPSEFMLKNIAKKKKDLKSVAWRSVFTKGNLKLKARTKVDWQDRIVRTRITDELEQPLYDFDSRIVFDRSQNAAETLGKVAVTVATAPDYKLIEEALLSRGIPIKTEEELLQLGDENERRGVEISGLGRFEKRAAWVVGTRSPAKRGESSQPQFWVEKDSFFPMRVILAETVEVRFDPFREAKGQTLPRGVNYQVRSLVIREEWGEVDVNMKGETVTGFQPGWSSAGKLISSDLREMIEEIVRFAR